MIENFIQEFQTNRHLQVFSCMAVVIGLDFFFGAFFFFRARNFLSNSVLKMAKIVKIQTYKTQKGTRDNLTVQYKDSKGYDYEGIISVVHGTHNGKEIEVLYHRDNPLNMRANNKAQLFLLSIIMLAIAITFSIIFALLLINTDILGKI